MYLQKLRSTLEKLNPYFWNAEIDRQVPGDPIEHAFDRYRIAARDRQAARDIGRLTDDIIESLKPWQDAFDILQDEFTSLFAKQVLSTYRSAMQGFAGVSVDNFRECTGLVVCMANKVFWVNGYVPCSATESVPEIMTAKQKRSAEIYKMKTENHSLTCESIAEKIGVHKSTVSRSEGWKMAMRVVVEEPRKGHYNKQRDGTFDIDGVDD